MTETSYSESDGGIQLIPGYRHKLATIPLLLSANGIFGATFVMRRTS